MGGGRERRGEGKGRKRKRGVFELAPLSCYRQMTILASTGWTITKQKKKKK